MVPVPTITGISPPSITESTQYFVLAGLAIAAALGIIAGFFAVLFTGEYPEGIRGFLVSAYRYTLRVEAYVGFLTDRYPPFSLAA